MKTYIITYIDEYGETQKMSVMAKDANNALAAAVDEIIDYEEILSVKIKK